MTEIQEQVKKFLIEDCGLTQEIGSDDSIFTSHVMDSLGVLILMNFLQQRFAIEISPFEVGLEDFDTLEKIEKLVMRKQVV